MYSCIQNRSGGERFGPGDVYSLINGKRRVELLPVGPDATGVLYANPLFERI